MNCDHFHADIALYVEGDLSPRGAAQLESHLSKCTACRDFVGAVRGNQTHILQLRNEIVEAGSLNRVRAGVLAQIRVIEERRTWFHHFAIRLWGILRPRFVLTGCLAMTVLGAAIWQLSYRSMPTQAPGTPPPIAQEHPIVAAVLPIAPPPPDRASFQPVKRRSPRPGRRSKNVAREDLVVQILTDDPNIIIYWLIDQNTGGF